MIKIKKLIIFLFIGFALVSFANAQTYEWKNITVWEFEIGENHSDWTVSSGVDFSALGHGIGGTEALSLQEDGAYAVPPKLYDGNSTREFYYREVWINFSNYGGYFMEYDVNYNAPTSGIGIWSDSPNFKIIIQPADTEIDTGVVAVVNTWYRLKIIVDNRSTNPYFPYANLTLEIYNLTGTELYNLSTNSSDVVDNAYFQHKNVDSASRFDNLVYAYWVLNTFPSYKNNRTNFTSIKTSQNGQFNITVEDDIALDTIILSFKNHTSAWENISTQRISGTSVDMAFNMSISTTRGQTQYWKFYINDSAGNWNETTTWNLIVQDTDPVWTTTISDLTIGEDNGTINGEDITNHVTDADGDTITYNVQTEDTSKVDVEITVADVLTYAPFPNWNGTTDVTIRACANLVCVDDIHTVTVNSVDDYGLWSNNMTNFTGIRYNENGAFNWTFEDEDFIKQCLFSYNNNSQGWVNDSWISKSGNTTDLTTSKNMTGKYNDIYEWRYYCEDNSGNVYNSSINLITINSTAPTITSLSPSNLTTKGTNYSNISVLASDTDNDNLIYWFYGNIYDNPNTTLISASHLNSFNWTMLNDTTYYWKVIVSDNISNISSEVYRFTVNTVSPAVNLEFPTNQQYINYNYTKWGNFTVYDANGVPNCSLYSDFNNSNWEKNMTLLNPVNDATTINNFTDFIYLPDNSYFYNVLCYDNVGNSGFASSNYTFTIDTIYPHLKIVLPTQDYGTTSTTLDLSIESTDTNLYWTYYSVLYKDNNQVYISNTTFTNQSSFIADASARGYILWFHNKDKALNPNQTSVNFTVSTPTTVTLAGGGGGVTVITREEIKEVIGLVCNFNGICEDDENPNDCSDCVWDLMAIFRGEAWAIRYAIYLLSGFFVYQLFRKRKPKQ